MVTRGGDAKTKRKTFMYLVVCAHTLKIGQMYSGAATVKLIL